MIEINNLVKNVEQYPSQDQVEQPEQTTQKPKVNLNENTANSMSFMDFRRHIGRKGQLSHISWKDKDSAPSSEQVWVVANSKTLTLFVSAQ